MSYCTINLDLHSTKIQPHHNLALPPCANVTRLAFFSATRPSRPTTVRLPTSRATGDDA